MSVSKYFALAGDKSHPVKASLRNDSRIPITVMDGDFFKGCIYSEAGWLTDAFKSDGLFTHESDELMVFIGGNPDDPENLNAEITLQIENDTLSITKTCFVFVPGGAAHGNLNIISLNTPVYHYICHLNTDMYSEKPASPSAPKGTYSGNVVEKYAPVDGKMPSAPEGFLTLLLWIDGKKLSGAPYMEAVWFNTVNDTGPPEHAHDFDEFIGFFGSDPDHPDELNGEISFLIDGEMFSFTKSCLIYIPRGVMHSPILVPKLERPILHFSGGNGGDYVRSGTDEF